MSKLRNSDVGTLFSISSLRFFLHYSTSANPTPHIPTNFLVNYLVKELDFSREAAASTSNKVPSLRSSENPYLVLDFFKSYGFDKTQIRNIVSSAPKLLTSDAIKTLKPKFRVLEDIGLSRSDLMKAISHNPIYLLRPLSSFIKPSLDSLKLILGSDEDVVEAIKKSALWLSYDTSKTLNLNLLMLKKYGLSDEKIKKFVIRSPMFATRKPEWVELIVHRVEEELGIPRESPLFFHGIKVISSYSKSEVETKFEVFRSFGWSDKDIIVMFRKLPYCLAMSTTKIRKGLNFFMKKLGYAPDYLASNPVLLMFSMENRVVPRNDVLRVLKERKLIKGQLSLLTVLMPSELKFVKRYMLPFKDDIPDLYEAYINRITTIGIEKEV